MKTGRPDFQGSDFVRRNEHPCFLGRLRLLVYSLVTLGATIPGLGSSECWGGFIQEFATATGATENGHNPVDAEVTFDIDPLNHQITITLTNRQADPSTVAQAISGLNFSLSTAETTGTMASDLSGSFGTELTVKSDGTFSIGSTVPTGWALNSNVSGGLQLSVLGAAGPAHLILGPPGSNGLYDKAGGSIAGNKPHNPFLNQSATFHVQVSQLTSQSRIEGVTVFFGTTAGNGVRMVPEPGSIVLLGLGMGAVVLIPRLRSRIRHSA